jgi:aspartate oxidase
MDITPTSDPTMITDAQRLAKSNSLLEKMAMGLPINPVIVTKRVLEAEQQEGVEELMTLPKPQGPSQEEKEFLLDVEKQKLEVLKAQADTILKLAQAEAAEEGAQLQQYSMMAKDMMAVIGLEQKTEDRKLAAEEKAAAKAVQPTTP